jgi:pSer/pThr/pTyr-binding forkhead associated (FHA) protein
MKIIVKLPSSKSLEFVVKKAKVMIGRSTKADISLPDESLSRLHAELEVSNDEFFVTDLGSANGVYLNDTRIPPHVRTSFTNYQELLIGQLEVQLIADVDENNKEQSNFSIGMQTRNGKENTEITEIKKASGKKNIPKLNNKKSSKKFNPFPLIAFSIALTGIAYRVIYKAEPPISEEKTKGLAIPDELKGIPNQFFSLSEYEQKDKLKSCENLESCKSLEIDTSIGEGLSFGDKEVVIFFGSDVANKLDKFKTYTKEDAALLASIYLTIKSNLFTKFQAKELGHIHIVLKNKDQAIIHVFRLHTSKFSKTGLEKSLLLTDLVTAIKNNSSDPFWRTAKPFIESREF